MEERYTIKEKVLEKIENGKRTIEKLGVVLNIDEEELKSILLELKEDLLVKEKDGNYFLTLDNNHKIGVLNITRNGLGVVDIEGFTYFIDETQLNRAIHGDLVLIKIVDPIRRIAIVEAKKGIYRELVGTVVIKNKNFFVNLDNPLIKKKFKLERRDEFLKTGDKVLIGLSSKNDEWYRVDVLEVLGNKNEVGVDVLSIIRELSIKDSFLEEELVEANKVKSYVDEFEIVDRVDLRGERNFTIDGEDSMDFDDSVGISLLDNKHYLLKVHIADVDHYVKEGSLLDKGALKRGATTYLLDRVIPMLPFELSNGICSLNPNEDRLTITYEMEYDWDGNLVRSDIYLSAIKSKERMVYDKVDDVLVNDNSSYYLEYQDDLRLLNELAEKLFKKRIENGYIDFNNKERVIQYDNDSGKVVAVLVKERMKSEKLIEECMLAANCCGTMFAISHNIPIINRVQDEMTIEELEKRLEVLEKMGFSVSSFKGTCSVNDMVKKVVDYYRESEFVETILRNVTNKNRAYYTDEQKWHSSLLEEHYAHFTSPIRRYPDLYSSRQLKKYLKNKKYEDRLSSEMLLDLNNKMMDIKLCSSRVEGLKLALYYQEKNEAMLARVINISEKFITVMFEELTTAILFKSDLDGYRFDRDTYRFVKKNGEVIQVGDNILVELSGIEKYYGKSNFKLCKKLIK